VSDAVSLGVLCRQKLSIGKEQFMKMNIHIRKIALTYIVFVKAPHYVPSAKEIKYLNQCLGITMKLIILCGTGLVLPV